MYSNTYLFYLLIAFLSSAIAVLAEKSKTARPALSFLLLFASFFILGFYATCCGVGIDREHYMYFYELTTYKKAYGGFEPLFNVISLFFKALSLNSQQYVMTLSCLTVVFVFLGIFINREKINYGLSVLVFSTLYYFQSYNLMRLYFVLSILVLFSFFLLRGYFFRYLIVACICCLIHYSCLFVVLTIVLILVFNRFNKKTMSIYKVLFFSAIVFMVALLGKFLAGPILSLFPSLYAKYSDYLNIDMSSFGFGWVFNIFPFFMLVLLSIKTKNKNYIIVSSSFYLMSLFLSIVGYFVGMVQRAVVLMGVSVIVYLPIIFNNLTRFKKRTTIANFSLNFKTIKVIIFAYYSLAFVFYLNQYMELDKINNYMFIWDLA